nr:cytochrome P450 [Ornithinimicrobium sp. F0845]
MITQVCDQAVADLLEPGTVVEVLHDYGRQVAVRVQCRWLGWPESLEGELLDWIEANFAATRSGEAARNAEVAAWFDRIVTDLVDDRRRRLAAGEDLPEDPTTGLLHDTVADTAAPGGQRPLTDPELVSILRNWTAGDLGSIAACIGVVVHHVATHLEEQARLRTLSGDEEHHTEELDAAVDEMLRLNDPFPFNKRRTLQDAELAGYRVPAGTAVVVNWTAANRDERVFPEPDAYRPAEHRADNIVYGAGPHICPGRVLSTLQIRGALAALLRATTSVELDPDRPPERYPFPSRGFDTVPVVLR